MAMAMVRVTAWVMARVMVRSKTDSMVSEPDRLDDERAD